MNSTKTLLRAVLFSTLFTITLFSKEYYVPLFDTNSSKGIWQMVGVTGLKDLSNDGSNPIDESTVDNPIIPDDDEVSSSSSTTDSLSESDSVYDDQGSSALEVEIEALFDINRSNSVFDELDSSGELVIFRYNPLSTTNKWLYYSNKNVTGDNEFSTFEKGVGYWAKYNDSRITDTTDKISYAGFRFDDSFQMGFDSYTGKVFEGWNLISIPDKRTIEAVYLVMISFDENRSYDFSVSAKSSLDRVPLTIDDNITEAVKLLNLELQEYDIFAFEVDSGDELPAIAMVSGDDFILTVNEDNISFYEEYPPTTTLSTESINARLVYGTFLDIDNSGELLQELSEYLITLTSEELDEDEDIDLIPYSSTLFSTTATAGVEAIFGDGNLTLVFGDRPFSIKDSNYIKRYDHDGSSTPSGFYSIDGDDTIFQVTDDRKDVNISLTSLKNSADYSVIKGYKTAVDTIEELTLEDDGAINQPTLQSGSKFIAGYYFPKSNSLQYFLKNLFDGYSPTQLLTLQTDDGGDGKKWDSIPISTDLTNWMELESRYDLQFHVDKRRAYWIKFVATNPITTTYSIDQSYLNREVIHQVSSDSTKITNVIHNSINITLRDNLKDVRGYIKIGNHEIELEVGQESDGSFTGYLDWEDLYFVTSLTSLTQVEVVFINENGITKNATLDLSFVKPEKPSDSITFETALSDSSIKLFKGELSEFNEITDLHVDLCDNFEAQDVYIVRVDGTGTANKLILSDPLKKSYYSLYKSTSRLDTKVVGYNSTPVKYDDSCSEVEDYGSYEGVKIGESDESLSLFYSKSANFVSSTEIEASPLVMYIKVNSTVVRIDFDSSYSGARFYVQDSSGLDLYTGLFTPDEYQNSQNPLTLTLAN